jgi:hypothetical protein
VRQRLKPFAVRIVGTNDGCDRARAEVLRQALSGEILPRVRRDWGAWKDTERSRLPFGSLLLGTGFAATTGRDDEARLALLVTRLEHGTPPGYEQRLGCAVGEVLARCMGAASTWEQRSWYWDTAIGLLDRLCDIGPEPRRPAVLDEQITRAEERLSGTWLSGMRRLVAGLGRQD